VRGGHGVHGGTWLTTRVVAGRPNARAFVHGGCVAGNEIENTIGGASDADRLRCCDRATASSIDAVRPEVSCGVATLLHRS